MSDIFLYADETGNLDYNTSGNSGASKYFGFGTAVFDRDHGGELWSGMRLRAEISGHSNAHVGIKLPKGFHAVNDKRDVRHKVYAEIATQAPRFDATFMRKSNAFGYVRLRGELWLYKYAWFCHLLRVGPLVATPNDTLYVIVASLGTARRQIEVERALMDVCLQTGLTIELCVWDSPTSWGLQVADYGLYAMQRKLEQLDGMWFDPYIQPLTQTITYPWGRS